MEKSTNNFKADEYLDAYLVSLELGGGEITEFQVLAPDCKDAVGVAMRQIADIEKVRIINSDFPIVYLTTKNLRDDSFNYFVISFRVDCCIEETGP